MKVFTWSDGFHAFTVAASSRPKALAAWGIRRDIFADGLAREITDGPDYEAALEQPEQVVERGLAVDIGEVSRKRTPKKAAPSRTARDKVRALEAELEELDRTQAQARAGLEAEAKRVADALSALAKTQDRDRKRLADRLRQARARLQG